MKIINPATMTNRQLMVEYDRPINKNSRYALVEEMTKRLGWKMITNEVVPVFKQYKLNGAGDRYQ